jgi:catechol 2,3-dioxygenase-like lactoylglutathione lyase family enzyme
MFDHISIGVRDIARSKRFYDAALKPLGVTCKSADASNLGYGAEEGIGLWIGATDKPVPADNKSFLHFCFAATTRKSVDQFHAAAVKQGGKENGAPGVRKDYSPTYYAAFVVDPDGYRLEVHCDKA